MRRLTLGLAAGALAVSVIAAPVAARPAVDGSIVDTAIAANAPGGPFEGQLDTLITAVVAADLVGVLDGRGQFTVFAPTDGAFAALGLDPSNVGSLDNAFLTDVLLYHVANGRRDAADVVSSTKLRRLNGQCTAIDGATIDGANIIVTDIFTTNGVIHVIDAVLLPS
jgi:uncharacterized surface protein with fasciclin (FAS1) repeats